MKSIIALVALAVAAQLSAQTAAAPAYVPPPTSILQTPAHLALADELVEAAGVSRTQMALIPNIVALVMPIMVRGNEEKSDEVRIIVSEEMTKAFVLKRVELLHTSRDAYARNLTDQELRDIIAFYRTPSGQRLVSLTPKIAGESMQAGQDIGQRAAMEALPNIIERMRKANLKVPERT